MIEEAMSSFDKDPIANHRKIGEDITPLLLWCRMERTLSFWTPPPWAIMAIAICLILLSSLCVPLVAGLSMFIAIRWVHQRLVSLKPHPNSRIFGAVTVCLLGATGLFLAFGWGVSALVDDQSGIPALMVKLTEALTLLRSMVPQGMASSIPDNADTALFLAQEWLKSHSAALPAVGKKVITLLFHIVIGAFIGVMTAITVLRRESVAGYEIVSQPPHPTWFTDLQTRLVRFTKAFENVFLAQINIALVNAILTGLFLGLVLPLFGYDIPFVKTLTALTFLLGLIPILGNLVSNTVIFLVGLSVAPMAGFLALAFLIVIHKLEYFLNAWIIGSKIHVKSYELLTAMLILEAFFGLWGLVLAPVIYAYLKEEIGLNKVKE